MRWKFFLIVFVSLVVILNGFFVVAVNPSGATVNSGISSSAPADIATSTVALAGNVTQLSIFGYSNTQTWQGYYGNVTGTIQLANSQDKVMYNWSLTAPEGEVYSSIADSLSWSNIQCFDMENNLTALEASYNIDPDDVDGVDETFSFNDHSEFYTNNVHFSSGACNNTKVYGTGGALTYDEVLLSDGTNTIFTSLLNDNAAGFDGSLWDFEMLVLEDGHGVDTDVETYFFWVELE